MNKTCFFYYILIVCRMFPLKTWSPSPSVSVVYHHNKAVDQFSPKLSGFIIAQESIFQLGGSSDLGWNH